MARMLPGELECGRMRSDAGALGRNVRGSAVRSPSPSYFSLVLAYSLPFSMILARSRVTV
jgi:hypothetical protein